MTATQWGRAGEDPGESYAPNTDSSSLVFLSSNRVFQKGRKLLWDYLFLEKPSFFLVMPKGISKTSLMKCSQTMLESHSYFFLGISIKLSSGSLHNP